MNLKAIDYLEKLLTSTTKKDYKVTIEDIMQIEKQYKNNDIIFPKKLTDFYIRYNEIIKFNIYFWEVPYIDNKLKAEPAYFARINLTPLITKLQIIGFSDVADSLNDLYDFYDGEVVYLDGLIPIGLDDGAACVCYKINDGTIIMYTLDLEDENDYTVVSERFEQLFDYLVIEE